MARRTNYSNEEKIRYIEEYEQSFDNVFVSVKHSIEVKNFSMWDLRKVFKLADMKASKFAKLYSDHHPVNFDWVFVGDDD